MFLPFQGTFFLRRGVTIWGWGEEVRACFRFGGVVGSLEAPSGPGWVVGSADSRRRLEGGSEGEGDSRPRPGGEDGGGAGSMMGLPYRRPGNRCGLNVSRLDRPREWRERGEEREGRSEVGFGVRNWPSSKMSESEAGREECSLSLPSLNQLRGSTLRAPAVWVRIQSSVSPLDVCRRALLARTAAAALRAEGPPSGGSEGPGRERRKGVSRFKR